MRENSVPGEKCVRNQQLDDEDKIFFIATTHCGLSKFPWKRKSRKMRRAR